MKKKFLILFITINLMAMQRRDHRLDLSFILNEPTPITSSAVSEQEISSKETMQTPPSKKRCISTITSSQSVMPILQCNHPWCDFVTIFDSAFIRHMRRHMDIQSYKCPYPSCAYVAATIKVLKKHMSAHHPEEAPK